MAECTPDCEPPSLSSFFLFGPRGAGKSSWVRGRYPRAPCIDFLDGEVFTELVAWPGRLLREGKVEVLPLADFFGSASEILGRSR